MKHIVHFLLLLFLSIPCIVFAQGKDSLPSDEQILAATSTTLVNPGPSLEDRKNHIADSLAEADVDYNAYDEYVKRKVIKSPEFMLSMMILVFAIILCTAEIIVFLKGHMDADQIIKLIIITLIIFAVLFLIVLGYTNDQIGPALGLLGTIAGYLLGKSQNKEHTKAAPPPTTQSPPQAPLQSNAQTQTNP